jgi:aspartyl-tRNA(Asn)/glutamyl-tRNA(Gln) amidotransferase subunit A
MALTAMSDTRFIPFFADDLTGIRIGYARSWHHGEGDPAIGAALDAAAQAVAKLGAVVDVVDLPSFDLFDALATVIIQAEAFAIHRAALATDPKAYGRTAYRHLAAGAVISAADLVQAQRLRLSMTRELHARAFSRFDVLLTANVLGTAPRFDDGDKTRNAFRVFPFNVSGHPAMAVPLGVAENGLPFGMQLVSRPFAEEVLCRVGDAYQRHVYSPARPAHD